MKKKDIVNLVRQETKLNVKESTDLVSSIFNAITSAVVDGQTVKIDGFGSFEAVKRKSREVRNPQNSEIMTIPEHFIPVFRPVKAFKDAVKDSH